jgi:hypothetical protein
LKWISKYQQIIRHSRESAGLSGEFAMGTDPKAQRPLCNSEPSWLDLIRLDPAIHVLATGTGDAGNRVDARIKPAHDDLPSAGSIKRQQPIPVPGQPCAKAESRAPRF